VPAAVEATADGEAGNGRTAPAAERGSYHGVRRSATDDTGWNCGDGLSPGIGWCGQCFEPVVRLPEASDNREPSDDRALHFDDLRIVHAPPPAIRRDAIRPERRSSLLRGGPTTPAIAGKLVLTAVAAGAGLYSISLRSWLMPSAGRRSR